MTGLGTTVLDLARLRRQWDRLMRPGRSEAPDEAVPPAPGNGAGPAASALPGASPAGAAALASPAIVAAPRFAAPGIAAAGVAAEATAAAAASRRLREITGFGSNPGALRMYAHVPARLSASPALVVVLHGCTQNAAGYDRGTGWSHLADKRGFAVVYAEQQRVNNPNDCFTWFQPGDTTRDRGEALSIRQMVERMAVDHAIDRRRIFVTGLSAGGAMTAVMLATYPEVFAGGAIIAGLPYGSAANVQEAFESMFQGRARPAGEWGDRVRAASAYAGPWPRLSVWHGSADAVVRAVNADEIVKQWTDVHGIAGLAPMADEVDGYSHRAWRDASGAIVVEDYRIAGMGHGTPLDPHAEMGTAQETGPHLLDAGISSTDHIARFWGLDDDAAGSMQAWLKRLSLPLSLIAQDKGAPRNGAKAEPPAASPDDSAAAAPAEPAHSPSAARPEGLLRKLLRAAGLIRA